MLPQLLAHKVLCYIYLYAPKKRRKSKKPQGVQKMENHLTGAFAFENLTPLSSFFRKLPQLLLLRTYRNYIHTLLIRIYKWQKKSSYHWAVFLNGIAALFLLPFFSYITIFYNRFLFKHTVEKACFSPGCRSPPLFLIFARLQKNQKRRKISWQK